MPFPVSHSRASLLPRLSHSSWGLLPLTSPLTMPRRTSVNQERRGGVKGGGEEPGTYKYIRLNFSEVDGPVPVLARVPGLYSPYKRAIMRLRISRETGWRP